MPLNLIRYDSPWVITIPPLNVLDSWAITEKVSPSETLSIFALNDEALKISSSNEIPVALKPLSLELIGSWFKSGLSCAASVILISKIPKPKRELESILGSYLTA